MTGCTPDAAPAASNSPSASAGAGSAEPHADLARRAASAKDRRYVASYTWTGPGGRRAVAVTKAGDGSWRVDLPPGVYANQGAVSVVGRPEGVYQCGGSGCVRAARTPGAVPSGSDAQVHHAFTDWLDVLTDRHAAVQVVTAQLEGASGVCFTVEPTTVAVAPPITGATLCFDDSGLLTGVKSKFGTLLLAGPAGEAPGTVSLPGPVTGGQPFATAPVPAASGQGGGGRTSPRSTPHTTKR
jgi:hypothetical protein